MSLTDVMATANQRASELGVDVADSLLTLTQHRQGEAALWRINYGLKDYIGRRGGDLILDIDARSSDVARVRWGQ